MFCENCGGKIEVGDLFCSECGTKAGPKLVSVRSENEPPPNTINKLFLTLGLVLSAILLIIANNILFKSSVEDSTASAAVSDVNWLDDFKSKKWQEMQGLSCGTNRFEIRDGNLVTTQGQNTTSKTFQIKNIDNSKKSFELVMTTYFRDGALKNMFPDNLDDVSARQEYNFQMLSPHKIKLTRRIQSINLEAMVRGESLSYSPAETDTHIIFDCDQ